METILIIVHLVIVIALVIVVLLQRSEGGALGIGGGGGGMMTARGAASALTRLTAILAAAFFITSLSLGLLARYGSQPTDILDRLPVNQGGSAIPGAGGGSLLDQLGGLPEDDGAAVDGDEPLAAPNAATPPAGGESVPTDSEPSPVTITPNEPTTEVPASDAAPQAAPVELPDAGAPASSDPVEQAPADTGASAPDSADAPSAPPAAIPPAINRPASGANGAAD